MRKFAPIAMLMALLTSLLLGSAATAQAADVWKCTNDKSIKLISCTLNDITVKVDVSDVANNNNIDIVKVEDSFNKNTVVLVNKITTGDITAAKNIVVQILKDVDVDVDVSDVTICVLSKGCK